MVDGKQVDTDGTGSTNTAANIQPAAGVFARLKQKWQEPGLGADDCLTYDQLRQLRERVRSKDDVTDEVAEELSAALQQAERIRVRNIYVAGAYDQLTFIVDCLLAAKTQLVLARDERLNLQIQIYSQARGIFKLLAKISSGNPVGLVLSALGFASVFWTLIMGVLFLISHEVRKGNLTFEGGKNISDIFFMDGTALTIITSAALLGGIVSIATRVNEFSRARDLDPFAIFWTAMLKPLIGVVLAIFILATLEGNVLNLGILKQNWQDGLSKRPMTNDAMQTLYILWMLGFLAGFSERFAWDFVGRAQGVASGTPGADTDRDKR